MMTAQEAFDKVTAHLLEQKARSVISDSPDRPVPGGKTCCYRGENGMKCAIGALIPDEMYSPDMEFNTAAGLIFKFQELPFSHLSERFLTHLQEVHDLSYDEEDSNKDMNMDKVKTGLRKVASDWNLDLPDSLKE